MLQVFGGIFKIGYILQVFGRIFLKVFGEKNILYHLGKLFNNTEHTLQEKITCDQTALFILVMLEKPE